VRNKKSITLILFAITYFAIFLSGRRAFILFFPAVLVGVTLYLLLNKRNRSAIIIALSSFILLFILFYFYLYDIVINILTRGSGTTIALSNREIYWDLALRLFGESPLWGKGMRSYDYYYNILSGRNIIFAGAHNCYLQMLAEIGLIGMILFCGLIFLMIAKTALSTVKCMRSNLNQIGQILMGALLMQCMFVCAGLSEAVFFAPFSCILFFILLGISNNSVYMCEQWIQKIDIEERDQYYA
jgi:O-antigen ligase